TPIPTAPTLDAVNEGLLARMDARLATGRDGAGETIGIRFAVEAPIFRAVSAAFVAEATTFVTVPPPGARAAGRRVLLGAVSLGGTRSRGPHRGGHGHHHRAGRHGDSAPPQTLRAALD